uniref:Guanylate cyclase n=1 Tax=Penaeus vannamei TaxID=6689 RepID=A0A646SXK8_PENVA|nr:membrane-bound guanylyl cyclase [Penaeus vannamei]
MSRSLAVLTCPVLVLAVLLCEAREMSRGASGRRPQHLRENELRSQEQGVLWSHEYSLNDGPSPLASSSFAALNSHARAARHRRTQPRGFDAFHTAPLPSSSNSPFAFSFNTTSREDYSLEEKCSHEQFRDTVKRQKDYIDNYLTQSYNDSRENITIGFLSSFTYNKLALGALPLAVEDVNNDHNLLPGKRLVFEVADVGNSNLEALAALSIRRMTTMRDKGHLVFIGPDDNCANEALVAAAWNLPMITYKCADKRVSNKTKYYTFARTMPPSTKIVKALVSLLKVYSWRQFVLLTEHTRNYQQIKEAVKSFADHHKMNITRELSVPYDYTTSGYHTIQGFVRGTIRSTRIYVLVASYEVQWDFVLALREEAGDHLAEYAIVTIDDDKYNGGSETQVVRVPGKDKEMLNMSKETADRLYHGFRAVVKITPAFPTNKKYREFEKKVLNRIKQYPFCVPYNPGIFPFIEVPISAAHLYDAVMMYAKVLHETLANPYADPANGTHILSLIKNRSFPSIQGFKLHMDENADAEGSYSLLAIRQLSSDHTPPMGWHKVGHFHFHDHRTGSHDMDNLPTLVMNDTILWLGAGPPLDAPKCGFASEKCGTDWSSLLGGGVVLMLVMVAALFLCRHYRYEQRLACLLWKIDMREVTILNDPAKVPSHAPVNNNTNLLWGGVDGQLEVPRVSYCKMGVYKNNIVAVKPVKKRNVDLTRSIRKELQQMREVRHENLLPFIGASVDTGAVCVLTAYCTRGSLEDVLANDDFLLDNMFVASLVADLIKGMMFLHDSEIVSHGNLRSSNCLIDSRWVLMVADFGLHEFKASPEVVIEPRKRLWTAPELLRRGASLPRGTQKGDAFSFGIILYEVMGRKGPWGDYMDKFTVQDILSKLRECCEPPLRPPLDTLKAPEYVHRCLRECWVEEPDERPDFKLIQMRLKEMQAGLKLNIVDNMLAMMEKYAYNLEGKVQERTKQLMEEKKKTEILLLRMLPKSVAESLKRGEKVHPESYDNVTIYFSDIVGFTSLSATSTPLQMVDMLNDLYTCFDAIIGDYDVYKVETIGDAYMVVSGLPICNGDRHAGEIASMALKLLDAARTFTIRHRPSDTLKLRIGIHSGPCVAGVVGLTMPRYCLFGDTVNTASRMESTGEQLRIHISNANKLMLDKIGGYLVEKRGLTYVKGKGQMMTWWLVGVQRPDERDPDALGDSQATPTRTPVDESHPSTAHTPTSSAQPSSLAQSAAVSSASPSGHCLVGYGIPPPAAAPSPSRHDTLASPGATRGLASGSPGFAHAGLTNSSSFTHDIEVTHNQPLNQRPELTNSPSFTRDIEVGHNPAITQKTEARNSPSFTHDVEVTHTPALVHCSPRPRTPSHATQGSPVGPPPAPRPRDTERDPALAPDALAGGGGSRAASGISTADHRLPLFNSAGDISSVQNSLDVKPVQTPPCKAALEREARQEAAQAESRRAEDPQLATASPRPQRAPLTVDSAVVPPLTSDVIQDLRNGSAVTLHYQPAPIAPNKQGSRKNFV